jgi:hypothetical protein
VCNDKTQNHWLLTLEGTHKADALFEVLLGTPTEKGELTIKIEHIGNDEWTFEINDNIAYIKAKTLSD